MGAQKDLDAAARSVLAHLHGTVGVDPAGWAAWPGGWRGEIGTALIDAVFSARAVYRTSSGRGVWQRVTAWQLANPAAQDSLHELVRTIESSTTEVWAAEFGNAQHSPRRASSAPGGPTKAATVLQAARALSSPPLSIDTATDLAAQDPDAVKRTLRAVPGIGYATTNYLFMLLGADGVKPDRMVHRFLRCATTDTWTDADAEAVIIRAAGLLDPPVAAHQLEHAIWKYESDRAAGLPGRASADASG